ncbi:Tetratricopeptide-like helical [Penicillium malachiteum]|nr:Tetratricopeptide-like helical [Penicillium malachiteum]
MVPFAQNPRFIGRQQEIDYLEHLNSHTSGPTKIAIHGLGGIGKTQIALELAYRIRERSTGCSVFWIPCVTYEGVEQTYMNISLALGISNSEPIKVKEQVKAHLGQGSVAKWLLIFDNVDDMELWIEGSATIPPLKDILPRGGKGHILFTSRNRKLAVKLAASNVISVPDVDQSTALNILKNSLIQEDLLQEIHPADSLLEQLGFLPLAISQAAAYIKEKDISLSDYLTLLKQEESSAAELLSEGFEDDARYAETQNPVITTWLISFQQIQQLNSLAADYLSFIACISPRGIPQTILPPAPSAKKRVDALGVLKAYSFISEHSSPHSISLHRLVHLAMRNWMRQTKVIDHWLHRAAQKLEELSLNDDRRLWRDYLPHAFYPTNGEEFQYVHPKFIRLTWKVGLSLSEYGRYNDARSIFTKNLDALEKTLGPEHLNTLTCLNSLGFLFMKQKKYNEAKAIYLRHKYREAEAMYRRALEGFEKALGPHHPNTLKSLGGLSSVFREQGRYKEAEALYCRALEGFEKSLGSENVNTLKTLGNIGLTLAAQCRYKEAETLYRQVLEGRQKALGPEHSSTLSAMTYIGIVLEQQDRYEEAKAMYKRALEGRVKTLGPEHHSAFSVANILASLLKRQNKYQDAETLYRQALKGRQKAIGPEHLDIISVINNLASVLEQQERYQDAETLYRQALEGYQKALGPEHPDTISVIENLASVLERQERYREAETLFQRALEGYEMVLGPENPHALFCINSLGFVLTQQGKHGEAKVMYERVLHVKEKALGSEHPDTLASVKKLAPLTEVSED